MDGANNENELTELEKIELLEKERHEALLKSPEYVKFRQEFGLDKEEENSKERQELARQEAERIKKREAEETVQAKEADKAKKRQAHAAQNKKLTKEVLSIAASLRTPGAEGGTGLDTANLVEPVYYVIVGRGPAAVINHTTLRQSEYGKKRINALPVMHIGFINPWTAYMQHGMGQPPHLLSLPGFEQHPDDATIDEGLDSREFARCVEDEYERLEATYVEKVLTLEAWVLWVQSTTLEKINLGENFIADERKPENNVTFKQKLTTDGLEKFIPTIDEKLKEKFRSKEAAYRLLVVNPKPAAELKSEDFFFIYASCIDICTGPGRPKVDKPEGESDTDCLIKARTAPWLPPEKWDGQWGKELKERRVFSAVEAIRDEVEWKGGERICVTAGGGVGLNAAEKARNESCKMDWFARTSLMQTFANPRNDSILRHPIEDRLLKAGERTSLNILRDRDLIPCKKELRYGCGAVLNKAVTSNGSVVITLKDYKEAKSILIKDYFKQEKSLADGCWEVSQNYQDSCGQTSSKNYDKLIVPNGQEPKELGHPYYFAKHLALEAITRDKRMVGLQTNDGKVRVLGAAAQVYPGFAQGDRNRAKTPPAANEMWNYHDALPVSAVVDGFIFSSVNIAIANEYFNDKRQNNNVNTATEDEIKKLLEKLYFEDSAYLASLIVDKRKRPANNGYESIEQIVRILYADELGHQIHLYNNRLDDLHQILKVGYEPSVDSDLLPER